ncbi:UbiA family prenyltransferase [Maribacter sp. 2308TA10-17]|uniref:UbiA family prenyltransferase n=1 Tax=Maribacter sp. 2308TA10-17 TaxID=3386276 RepID=UPI0039BCF012
MNLLDLKISRPGLWFPTLWIYLVPFGNQENFWQSWLFWLGLFFVTFPLNYLVYGLNDYNDEKADAVNERKGNFLFGAKAPRSHLDGLLKKITWVILPFVALFTYLSGFKMFLLLVFMVLVNIIYNFKPFRIKERPPFEILIQIGYVTTAFFATELNNLEILPWQTLTYLSLFAFQAHIAGEIMDIEPDLKSGKRTTASLLGRKKSKLLMLTLLLVESFLVWFWFKDLVLALFLLVFSIWLVLDVFIFFKDKPYTLPQMKLFGYAINLSAMLSMAWVLYSGKLLLG